VYRQVANAEILSMSLLMEDVLLTGFVEKSVFLRTDDSSVGEAGRRRQGSIGRRMSIASPTRSATSNAAAGRKGSDATRRMSDVGGLSSLFIIHCRFVHWLPFSAKSVCHVLI